MAAAQAKDIFGPKSRHVQLDLDWKHGQLAPEGFGSALGETFCRVAINRPFATSVGQCAGTMMRSPVASRLKRLMGPG